jgi:hypothetical protein
MIILCNDGEGALKSRKISLHCCQTAMEAMALFSMMVGKLFRRAGDIPHRGKHLDQFELIDLAFLSFNKVNHTIHHPDAVLV